MRGLPMPLLLLLLLQLSTLQAIAKSHEAVERSGVGVRVGVAPRRGDGTNLPPKPVNQTDDDTTPRNFCSGSVNFMGNSGMITVGGPGEQYQNGMDCEWNIETDPGTTITFNFTHFDVEHEPSCDYDYVEFWEGDSILGARMCGSALPGPITSATNQVTVKFHSDDDYFKSGFHLSYQANVPTPEGTCSGSVNLIGNSGVITVGGPDEKYENNADCAWNIETDHGTTITLTFTYFDVEPHSSCGYDYVEFVEGGSTLGSRMCGDDLPDPITSVSNKVTVKFHSDHVDPFTGFVLSYQSNGEPAEPAEQDVCDGDDVILDYGESVVLYGNATSKAICKTLIKVPKGAEIGYDCPLFDLNKKGCRREKLKLESKWGVYKQKTYNCMNDAPDGVVFPSTRNNRVTYKRAKVRKNDETNGFRCNVYTVGESKKSPVNSQQSHTKEVQLP